VLNTLVVTAVNGNTYTYTLNGVEGTATSIEQLVIAAATYSDQVESVPGKQYDANYQLTYTNGEKIVESNIVSSKGLRTVVEVEKLYRSGTPDPENNASQELYTCNVRFKPVMQSNVANYVLWQNAEKSLIRVDQTDGKTFTLVTKDEQGNFNVPAGTVSPDNEGYITLRINTSLDKKARLYEMNKYQNKFTDGDLFFTIEVCATGGNSYGNYEQGSGFAGLDAEHVVLVNAELFKGVNKATGKYRAEISWSKNNNPAIDAEDYVYNEPDYYTVHRWLRTDGYKQYGVDNVPCGYSPIKTFYKGSDETGYEVAQTTEDAEGLKFVPDNMNNGSFSIIDFVNDSKNPTSDFPAMYYVKAHYKSPFNGKATFVNANGDLQNYMEKNSYVTSVTIGQITGVDEIETSQVVSVKYYNMMGIEVAQPEAGEIVVARTQYANGVVTSKVIKK
ncbi:MAG: hypothetical protein KBT09_05800, partial [Bacteroidales bacterium]|nr:hypothetical protein [Candidatus Sodaliphilus fimicaballi]